MITAVLFFGAAAIGSAEEPAKFFRGLNLNGDAVTIDANKWD